MDTVYLALGVFQWKTTSELGTVQSYAPPYIVSISQYELYVLYWNVHKGVSNLEGESNAMARGAMDERGITKSTGNISEPVEKFSIPVFLILTVGLVMM